MPDVKMIDVSANNHGDDKSIDWHLVRQARYDAVMIKCSEGLDYVNPWLTEDADGAHAAGLLVGFYHFAHPGQNLYTVEAAHAIWSCIGLTHDLGLALDLEVQEGQSWQDLATFARGFHQEVRKRFAHSPLYVDDYFLDNLPGAPWGWRLWLAQTARPRREVWAWQGTTPASVPGITGLVDVGFLRPSTGTAAS